VFAQRHLPVLESAFEGKMNELKHSGLSGRFGGATSNPAQRSNRRAVKNKIRHCLTTGTDLTVPVKIFTTTLTFLLDNEKVADGGVTDVWCHLKPTSPKEIFQDKLIYHSVFNINYRS